MSEAATIEAPDRTIWRDELTAMTRRTSNTIRLWIKSGKLPQPDVKISPQTMGWKASTLRAAGVDLVEASQQKTAA